MTCTRCISSSRRRRGLPQCLRDKKLEAPASPNSMPCTEGAVVWRLPACHVAQMGNQSSCTGDSHPKPPVFPLPTRPGTCPLPAGIHHLYSVPAVLG